MIAVILPRGDGGRKRDGGALNKNSSRLVQGNLNGKRWSVYLARSWAGILPQEN